MKIYTVTHYYNNGESYEDYREYVDVWYYSALEYAQIIFSEFVAKGYGGQFVLKEVTLDSQEVNILEKSEYVRCISASEEYYYHRD